MNNGCLFHYKNQKLEDEKTKFFARILFKLALQIRLFAKYYQIAIICAFASSLLHSHMQHLLIIYVNVVKCTNMLQKNISLFLFAIFTGDNWKCQTRICQTLPNSKHDHEEQPHYTTVYLTNIRQIGEYVEQAL